MAIVGALGLLLCDMKELRDRNDSGWSRDFRILEGPPDPAS